MSFHLVDRIVAIDGDHARGRFVVPATGPRLSPCLIAEAIGQLASWVAMERAGFLSRPVAGIAGEVTLEAEPAPGEVLDLTVGITRCDDTAVAYSGAAHLGDRRLLEMKNCIGPMMPSEVFDDPAALRERFARLRDGGGAEFPCAPGAPELTPLGDGPDGERRARLQIPEEATLFAAHFPHRPVYPGTLLLDAEVRHAARVALGAVSAEEGARLRPRRARSIKFRAFLSPGDTVDLLAKVDRIDAAGVRLRLTAERDGQRVGDARIEIAREE